MKNRVCLISTFIYVCTSFTRLANNQKYSLCQKIISMLRRKILKNWPLNQKNTIYQYFRNNQPPKTYDTNINKRFWQYLVEPVVVVFNQIHEEGESELGTLMMHVSKLRDGQGELLNNMRNNKTSIQWTPGSQINLSSKKIFWSKMIFEQKNQKMHKSCIIYV